MNFEDLVSTDLKEISTSRLRQIAEYMRKWLPLVETRLRQEDERELSEARARVAEIEARLGVSRPAVIPAVPKQSREPSDWDGTDAGMGVGESTAPVMVSTESFKNELASLRERNMERRRRRGLA